MCLGRKVAFDGELKIYTDGSSLQSPRNGGIGIRFVTIDSSGDEQVQDIQFLGYKNATNNKMELLACVMALKEAIRLQLTLNVSNINIFTDSLYIVDNIQKAKFEWPKSKWYLRSGRPVLNADLWKDLIKLIKNVKARIEFKWVEGHSKNIHNRVADKLAKQSAKLAVNKLHSVVKVRRKITSKSVDIGSVDMYGQRITIRIITSEYLTVQHLSKYKYEVISKKSNYYGNVDLIFSDQNLKTGHSYFVRVNSDIKNPRIIKVFRELFLK